jgi:hypothetical protein
MSDPVIRRPLACVQCGYDLEGLSARGSCPECGRDIIASLAHRLDLAAPGEPAAIDSRRLAVALALATIGCLAGTARLPEYALAYVGEALLREGATAGEPIPQIVALLATALHATAIVGTALGLVALAVVLPRRDERRVLRIRVLGCVGFALWLALSLSPPTIAGLTATALPAGMTLLALGPVFRELGPRSRVYRDRESAKQRIDELLLAIVIAGCASFAALLAAPDPSNETVVALLRLVSAASAALAAVGLGYLTLNVVWIVRAIFQPDLTVADVFGTQDPRPVETGDSDLRDGRSKP